MKLKIAFCVVIIAGVLCACSNGGDGMIINRKDIETDVADKQMDKILSAIQEHSTEDLTALFATKAVKEAGNLDEVAAELYAYCPETFLDYNNWGGPNSETEWEDGHCVTRLYATYDVKTADGGYRFAFLYISEDTQDPENVGIWSVYVIAQEEDADLQYAYRGDGLYSSGIHIGIKNALPHEE